MRGLSLRGSLFLSYPGVRSICSPFLSPGVSCWTDSAPAFQTAGGASPAFQPTLSLSRTFPTPHVPRKERGRGTLRHTQRQRGRKTESQWEATGGEQKKMLTFAVFQSETSDLSKHLERIECPSAAAGKKTSSSHMKSAAD